MEQGWLGLPDERVRWLEDNALATLLSTQCHATLLGRDALPHHQVSQCATLFKSVRLLPNARVANLCAFAKRQRKVVVNLGFQLWRQLALLHCINELTLQLVKHYRVGLELACRAKHSRPRCLRVSQVLQTRRSSLVHHAPHLASVGRVSLTNCREGRSTDIAATYSCAVSLRGGRALHALFHLLTKSLRRLDLGLGLDKFSRLATSLSALSGGDCLFTISKQALGNIESALQRR